MRPFEELRVWQAAHGLTLDLYRETAEFPRDEIYGLTSQMRRAAASIGANIAEGSARGDSEFHQHLRIALGSAAELEYHLLLAKDLGFLSATDYELSQKRVLEVQRMLASLARHIKGSGARQAAAQTINR